MPSAKILNNRYAISEEVREGGMSTVTRAFDLKNHIVCAIKRMKKKADEMRLKESFNREHAALSELVGHHNIVTLLDGDSDDSGTFFVLEWVPYNLQEWIKTKGRLTWDNYYREIGRPVLEAIVFAQGRGWSHRDIKPANILVSEKGEAKISDYGIAKRLDRPAVGLTFSAFRSQPFTPPEDDRGDEWRCSRDCFSWAAVSVLCLTGELPDDYGRLAELVSGLDRNSAPVEVLECALSHVPSERPPLATALLADLDFWQEQRS
jgi:serine/threonine protein kinase